ncbi:MAG TPA: type II toxin-antitoxin system prevent-host-death family antitoxin [Thermoanaerobaculia bacterium]|nr:type II toxin-antitoxin system prevent-host-death family antitoxin [Thermoanaerobaculia bacterium]
MRRSRRPDAPLFRLGLFTVRLFWQAPWRSGSTRPRPSSRLLVRVNAGEEIVITKAGKPIARLVPFRRLLRDRIGGQDRGRLRIAEDFDAPLREDVLRVFRRLNSVIDAMKTVISGTRTS